MFISGTMDMQLFINEDIMITRDDTSEMVAINLPKYLMIVINESL